MIDPNTYWGAWMTDFTLRSRFHNPTGWDPAAPVALYLPLGEAGDFSHPEALAYIDGALRRLRPLPSGNSATRALARRTVPPAGAAWLDRPGRHLGPGEPGTKLFMRACAVVQIDQPTRDFIATARVALGIADALERKRAGSRPPAQRAGRGLQSLDTREPFGAAFYASVPPAHAVLRAGIEKPARRWMSSIVATGHAHIDVAWLWTLGQTRAKPAAPSIPSCA